jgi:hypothetical protein
MADAVFSQHFMMSWAFRCPVFPPDAPDNSAVFTGLRRGSEGRLCRAARRPIATFLLEIRALSVHAEAHSGEV